MNCKQIKFFGIFLPLFFFNSWCYAQNNNHSNVDSSDSFVDKDSASNDSENIVDTVVEKTIFETTNDSILKWKKSAEFGYMSYLDSLLRKKKNELMVDTVSIDNNSGRSKSGSVSVPTAGSTGFLNSFPVKIFFWLLAIFFIGFILYRLFFKEGLFAKGKAKYDKEPVNEEPEELSEYSTYNELIYEAETLKDFNLAVRYLYLQSLKKLSDSELILFSPDKTNKVYVQELSGHSYQSDFASLTVNYEYVWYGKFSISYNRYLQLKEEFISFNKKI